MKHLSSPSQSHDEGTNRVTQLKTIFQYLQDNICTGSMLSKATGISQKNFCRYKRDLELSGRLWEVKKDICELTGFKAWYVSTNPEYKPKHFQQLSLFEGGLNND